MTDGKRNCVESTSGLSGKIGNMGTSGWMGRRGDKGTTRGLKLPKSS